MALAVYEEEESVYRLIPAAETHVEKKKMYRSKHNATVPPSYSTFGTTGTTRRVGNPSGAERDLDEVGGHKARKAYSSMGQSVAATVNPSAFLKKTSKDIPPPETKFERKAPTEKRPPVPKVTDKPVLGLTTDKNFVVSNAVDTILAPPKKTQKEEVKMTQKRGYGRPPGYLRKIQGELTKEKERTAAATEAAASQNDPHLRLLTDDEKRNLLRSLSAKWQQLNKSYQALTFSMDTVTKVSRKEAQEAELDKLEKAMNKLQNKRCVFVYDDANVGFETLGIQGCDPRNASQ